MTYHTCHGMAGPSHEPRQGPATPPECPVRFCARSQGHRGPHMAHASTALPGWVQRARENALPTGGTHTGAYAYERK